MSTQTKPATRKFTAETAVQFDHYSQTNATILSLACPTCQAYKDWLTYQRWLALNFQVQRGEHGTKLQIYVDRPSKDDETKSIRIPWHVTVFCKHQVKPIES